MEAQRRVALNYFEDGSVESACPPLKALLHIMAHGEFEGMGAGRSAIPRAVRARSGARKRLVSGTAALQAGARHRAVAAASRGACRNFHPDMPRNSAPAISIWKSGCKLRAKQLARVSSPAYLGELRGTIGADPFTGQLVS